MFPHGVNTATDTGDRQGDGNGGQQGARFKTLSTDTSVHSASKRRGAGANKVSRNVVSHIIKTVIHL